MTRFLLPILVTLTLMLPACSKKTAPVAGAESHDHKDDHDSHADEVVLTEQAIASNGITIEVAEAQVLRPVVTTPAHVSFNADATRHIASPLRGRILEIAPALGDSVRKGDPLVVLESPDLGDAQAEYLERRTAVDRALPAIELAKASWDRAKSLFERSQGISLNEVQRRETEYNSAVAMKQSAEASLRASSQRLQLLGMSEKQLDALNQTGTISAQHSILAPAAGLVIERNAAVGELTGPEHESILTLADPEMLWVIADVPETAISSMKAGQRCRILVGDSSAALQSMSDRSPRPAFEGEIAVIEPRVDPTTRTVSVRVRLVREAPGQPSPTAGSFVQVEFTLKPTSDGVIVAVPQDAIQTHEGSSVVFIPVEDETNTFSPRAVSVGKPVGNMVPVVSGLKAGDRFVATGSFILKAELAKGTAEHSH